MSKMADKPKASGNGKMIVPGGALSELAEETKRLLAVVKKIRKGGLIESDEWFNKLVAWADKYNIPLEKFPRDKQGLLNLTTLDLSYNNLNELPAEIGGLSNLTELDLGSNNISELPAEIGQLSNLGYLVLQNNNISELPAEIGQLSKLEKLYLGGNPIKALPPELAHLNDIVDWIEQ